jgi:hypothetical protein
MKRFCWKDWRPLCKKIRKLERRTSQKKGYTDEEMCSFVITIDRDDGLFNSAFSIKTM